MAIPLPKLDDRQYDGLLKEMRSYIHRYAPQWTDHNATDPGITMLELFTWLTEMSLYRLNRIPERHYQTLLSLTGNNRRPGAPAEAVVTLTLSEQRSQQVVTVPQGTIFTAYSPLVDKVIPFLTAEEVLIPKDRTTADVNVVNVYRVEGELMGQSNGRTFQVFTFKKQPVYVAPGFVNDSGSRAWYFNPRITVDGEPWTKVENILDAAHNDKVFVLDESAGEIRFGNGIHGLIPSRGASIVCDSYYRSGGSGGNVGIGGINTLASPIPGVDAADVLVGVSNSRPAAGGEDRESLTAAFARTVGDLHKPYRAVSHGDFEILAKEAAPMDVQYARCLTDRNLESQEGVETGHISVIVMPAAPNGDGMHIPSKELKEKVLNHLHPRRLITTRLHVVGPEYLNVYINFRLTPKADVKLPQLNATVEQRLQRFLSPIHGGFAESGWPLGRDVFASEIYKVIGNVPGVDYVTDVELIPEAHFFTLYFDPLEVPDTLPMGSYIQCGAMRFPLAQPINSGSAIRRMIVSVFKVNDGVLLSFADNPLIERCLTVSRVWHGNGQTLNISCDAAEVFGMFPDGSIIRSTDNTVIGEFNEIVGAPAGRYDIAVRFPVVGDTVTITSPEGNIAHTVQISAITPCRDRVYLEEHFLPRYVPGGFLYNADGESFSIYRD